ncbi:MAG: hypothetical protein ACSHYA_14740 [Opitutaceae bacterium]
MDTRLEELRAQRALIKNHLDWIDRQLAEAEGSTDAPTDDPIPISAPDLPPKAEPLSTPETSINKTEIDDEAIDLKHYASPIKNDIRTANIGCIALFVIGSGLFLFLLFGLPYLLD